MEERRRNGRWQINQEARVSLLGETPLSLDCVINDITFRGVKVSLNQKLPETAALNINIDLPGGTSLNALEAETVWYQEMRGRHTYGFRFRRIMDADKGKIYAFVYKNFPQEITQCWWRGMK